ncbi:MAG: RNA polymerase sigma factor [Rufibacter sp.]
MSHSTLTEQDLQEEHEWVLKAKKDPQVFQVLYDRYFTMIFKFIFHKVRDKEITSDLTSQVFFLALQNLGKYQFKGVPFSAWLYRIASNETTKFFKKSQAVHFISVEDSLISELADEEHAKLHLEYKLNLLEKAMQCLQVEDVQLIELRFQESKSFKEIGEILDITENNAKVKTYRVLDKIKKELKKSSVLAAATANPVFSLVQFEPHL